MTNPKPGSRVEIVTKKQVFSGILVPSPESSDDVILLKLDSGYNIGLRKDKITDLRLLELPPKTEAKEQPHISSDDRLPTIAILHTGGTIASRVDYRTGGVVARFDPDEMLDLFPGIKGMANFKSRQVAQIMSEEIRFPHYNIMAEAIKQEIESGVDGVIVTHGTDTLHYSAAALGFMLQSVPVPVLLVGAQRSSDRGSTDAQVNLISAVYFATHSDYSGVAICMHDSSSDESAWIIGPFNTRKLHTSRRDAFRPVNSSPIARVYPRQQRILFIEKNYALRDKTRQLTATKIDENLKIGFLKTHPNMYAEEVLAYSGFDALIIEGTGLGHFPSTKIDEYTSENKKIFNAVEKLAKDGTVVAIAPQTIFGRVQLSVYSNAREIRKIGVLGHLCDMTSETAFIKITWLLSNYPREEARELYEKNLFGEISERSAVSNFLV